MGKNKMLRIMEKLSNNEYKKLSVNAKFLYLSLVYESKALNTEIIELTNMKVRELLSVSNKTAVKVIKELEKFSLIKKFKQNKNTNFVKLYDTNKTKKSIKLIKFDNKLYTNINKKVYNYDWLKTSYERFGM